MSACDPSSTLVHCPFLPVFVSLGCLGLLPILYLCCASQNISRGTIVQPYGQLHHRPCLPVLVAHLLPVVWLQATALHEAWSSEKAQRIQLTDRLVRKEAELTDQLMLNDANQNTIRYRHTWAQCSCTAGRVVLVSATQYCVCCYSPEAASQAAYNMDLICCRLHVAQRCNGTCRCVALMQALYPSELGLSLSKTQASSRRQASLLCMH